MKSSQSTVIRDPSAPFLPIRRIKILPSGVPAIHSQVASGHKAACVADQEHCCTTILGRRAQTAKHVLSGPLLATLGVLDEELLDHGGDDVARGDGVDADAVLAPFGSEVSRELQDTGLGGVVRWADEALLTWLC